MRMSATATWVGVTLPPELPPAVSSAGPSSCAGAEAGSVPSGRSNCQLGVPLRATSRLMTGSCRTNSATRTSPESSGSSASSARSCFIAAMLSALPPAALAKVTSPSSAPSAGQAVIFTSPAMVSLRPVAVSTALSTSRFTTSEEMNIGASSTVPTTRIARTRMKIRKPRIKMSPVKSGEGRTGVRAGKGPPVATLPQDARFPPSCTQM